MDPPEFEDHHPKYLECLRNHAATTGGNVVDGCREFMPSGCESLICAACHCHRSFHLKIDSKTPSMYRIVLHQAPPQTGSSSQEIGDASGSSRKRFRTRFGAEQKKKMAEFAAGMGWRMQNRREEEIQRFCAEIGVRRQIFKVWMHNNKNSRHRGE